MSKPLPKTLKLFEKHLLEYPPKEGTWKCVTKTADGVCSTVNGSTQEKCWLCSTPKGDHPTLLWPLYLVACKKMEVEPGEMKFKFNGTKTMYWVAGKSVKWTPWGEEVEPPKAKPRTRRR